VVMSIHPTPFPAVNILLDKLLSGVRTILTNNFVGLYLYGSLASGDFNLERSDIDFVVITVAGVPAEVIFALEKMHNHLAKSGLKLAGKLEGSYVPKAVIRRHRLSEAQYPTINEGKFYLGRLDSDWIIRRHILREQGIVVAGLPLQTLIDPVLPDELRRAALALLNEWWSPMLDHPARLQTSGYQAYAVLTMCRLLFTLRNGTIASKLVSARWAQENYGSPWAVLIEQALEWQHGQKLNKLRETQSFIKFILERSKQMSV